MRNGATTLGPYSLVQPYYVAGKDFYAMLLSAAAMIGYIGIIFVMFSGARRLEIRKNKNYGQDPENQKYVKTVPILVPFVTLYSVEKYKFLVA
ncbi:MAG: hypothetical protein IJX71_04965 [Oscillospiraceae bacterium]|nr:hypothetical protein [Oscillospiraceae bacterium]